MNGIFKSPNMKGTNDGLVLHVSCDLFFLKKNVSTYTMTLTHNAMMNLLPTYPQKEQLLVHCYHLLKISSEKKKSKKNHQLYSVI